MKPWLIAVGALVMLLAIPLDMSLLSGINLYTMLTIPQALAVIYNFAALVVSGFLVLLGATWANGNQKQA